MIIVNQTLFFDVFYDFEMLYKSGPLVLVYVYHRSVVYGTRQTLVINFDIYKGY